MAPLDGRHLDMASRALIVAVQQVLKPNKHAKEVKGAFVGGTAVNKLVPNYRATTDVDMQISGLSKLATDYNRNKLVADIAKECNVKGQIPIWTVNREAICGLTYTLKDGNDTHHIKIDVIDSSVNGWRLTASRTIMNLTARDGLPFPSRDDMLCTKVRGCWNRLQDNRNDPKAAQDLLDMQMMISMNHGYVKGKTEIAHLEKYLPQVYKIVEKQTGWKLEHWYLALIEPKAPEKKSTSSGHNSSVHKSSSGTKK